MSAEEQPLIPAFQNPDRNMNFDIFLNSTTTEYKSIVHDSMSRVSSEIWLKESSSLFASIFFLFAFFVYLTVFDVGYYGKHDHMNLIWDVIGIMVNALGLFAIHARAFPALMTYLLFSFAVFAHMNFFFMSFEFFEKENTHMEYFIVTCFYYMILTAVQMYVFYAGFKCFYLLAKREQEL